MEQLRTFCKALNISNHDLNFLQCGTLSDLAEQDSDIFNRNATLPQLVHQHERLLKLGNLLIGKVLRLKKINSPIVASGLPT